MPGHDLITRNGDADGPAIARNPSLVSRSPAWLSSGTTDPRRPVL
jgi:hypothetical protein